MCLRLGSVNYMAKRSVTSNWNLKTRATPKSQPSDFCPSSLVKALAECCFRPPFNVRGMCLLLDGSGSTHALATTSTHSTITVNEDSRFIGRNKNKTRYNNKGCVAAAPEAFPPLSKTLMSLGSVRGTGALWGAPAKRSVDGAFDRGRGFIARVQVRTEVAALPEPRPLGGITTKSHLQHSREPTTCSHSRREPPAYL